MNSSSLLRWLAATLSASALFGCAQTTPETPNATAATAQTTTSSAPEAATAPTSAPAATTAPAETPTTTPTADAKEIELEINPTDLSFDDAKGKASYDPDRTRMAADYKTYVFETAELKAVVGEKNLKKKLKLRVAVLSSTTKRSTPKDPNLPQPMGGFTYETIVCKPLKLLSAE